MSFPYDALPWYRSWNKAVRDVDAEAFDAQGFGKFHLDRHARIASAGSCFAVRVAEYLRAFGFNYLSVEQGGALLPHELATRFGYRPLSARYGNVYTSRQLLQLLERALMTFEPGEAPWPSDGGFVDPFRPRIQPYPFASVAELEVDRQNHLAGVRTMFESLDLFIFTLGQTELWTSRDDGAAFPACPGRGFGTFDERKYQFINLDVAGVMADLDRFLELLRAINPSAKVILTVSPVPLVATMLPMHVARASMLAKSTLVVAAEAIALRYEHVDYYASYETVMYGGGLDPMSLDKRHVAQPVVQRVVAAMLQHYFGINASELATDGDPEPDVYIKPCDEDELARAIDADRGTGSIAQRSAQSDVEHDDPKAIGI